MKKFLIALNIMIWSFVAYEVRANPIDDACPQHVLRGAPVSSFTANTQYLCKTNYAVHYRYDTKTAEYIVQHITIDKVTGPAKRKDDFRADPDIPKQHQSQLADYAGNPYDRGHLSPGADNTQNDTVMSESFYLSNMVPQVPNHNRGIWRILEANVRNWVKQGMDIYIVSGTIYSDGYQTIGAGQVGIPTYMWKVVVDRKSTKTVAFLLPNAPIPVKDLPNYVTTVAEIEKYTGINFHPQLPAQLQHIESDAPDLNHFVIK